MKSTRESKGKQIAEQNVISEIDKDIYLVPSQSNGEKYRVLNQSGMWNCNCPDYQYRMKGKKCKHIHAVMFWGDFKAHATKTEQYQELQEAEVSCIYCSSLNVVKNGARKNMHTVKQRYKCKACNKFFVLNQEFARLKGDEKAVTMAIDLYLKGLSLKKIADTLEQFNSVKVHYSTVYRWIGKFMAIINDYVAQFYPEKVSFIVHSDETMIKTKLDDYVWCWNSIDSETKFLLASTISKGRNLSCAKAHFKEVKKAYSQKAAYQKPAYIFTDGLPAYQKSIQRVFNPRRGRKSKRGQYLVTKHIANVGIAERESNNKVERLHGSQKERLKVMRGVNHKKALEKNMQNWRTYYNFVREHQGLGKTPAEASGIELNLNGNKWASLIRKGNR